MSQFIDIFNCNCRMCACMGLFWLTSSLVNEWHKWLLWVVVSIGLFWYCSLPFLYNGVYHQPSKNSLLSAQSHIYNSNTLFLCILHTHLQNCVFLFYIPLQNMTLFTQLIKKYINTPLYENKQFEIKKIQWRLLEFQDECLQFVKKINCKFHFGH